MAIENFHCNIVRVLVSFLFFNTCVICGFCSSWFRFVVIIRIHVIVSHAISIVTVIMSLFKGNVIVSVIWVCCLCSVLFMSVKSAVLQSLRSEVESF